MTRKVVVEINPTDDFYCRYVDGPGCRFLIEVEGRSDMALCALLGQTIWDGRRPVECKRTELPARPFSAAPGGVKP